MRGEIILAGRCGKGFHQQPTVVRGMERLADNFLRRINGSLTVCWHCAFMEFLSACAGMLMKVGLVALIANEVRGLVLAAPVLYGMYMAGGTGMAMWLGFCSLAGIALSVVVPLALARRFNLIPARAVARR